MINFIEPLELTKDNILKEIDSYSIFRHYIGDFKIGKAISSPLRKDEHPSFTVNINRTTNQFFFHDKVLGGGGAIEFVQKLFGLSYTDAKVAIVHDLGIADRFRLRKYQIKENFHKKIQYKIDPKELKAEVELRYKSREWNLADKAFWTSFGITKTTLNNYNVVPITHIFFKDSIKTADKLAYAFREFKDSEETITIYQPFNKDFKWIKTHDSSVWYGWEQLPDKAKKLIITKSLKDVMSIVDVMNYASTGLQNEKILPKLGVILELRGRFDDIYYLGDNDFDKEENWGQIAAKRLENEFHFNLLKIPDEYKCKDFSDLVKKFGPKKAKEILNNEINNVIYF